MLRYFIFTAFIFTNFVLLGQTNYKETETMAFNLLVGYQSFPSQDDIDAKLTANNFTKLNNSPLTLGIEFAIAGKKVLVKFNLEGHLFLLLRKFRK